MKKNLKYSLLAVVFLIIITEIIFRAFYHEQLKSRHTSTNKIPDSLLVFTRKPNGEELIISPSLHHKFRINNHGFVGRDFNLKKHPDTFRIVFIGNSNAATTQMNSNNNYITYLRSIFDNYGFKVEVLNCAREGTYKDIQNINSIKLDYDRLDYDYKCNKKGKRPFSTKCITKLQVNLPMVIGVLWIFLLIFEFLKEYNIII